MDKVSEEDGGLTRPDLRLDNVDKHGGDGGEHTGLRPSQQAHAGAPSGTHNIRVVFKSSSYLSMKSRSYSSASLG